MAHASHLAAATVLAVALLSTTGPAAASPALALGPTRTASTTASTTASATQPLQQSPPAQDLAPTLDRQLGAAQSRALGGLATGLPPGARAIPDIATKSWVLADLDTGVILAAKNPDLPMRPASTLKLLTALTVAPRLNPNQPYRAVKADEVAEGNRVVLYKGLTYKVKDLLHAALLPSANDAAQALARANGGIPATVDQMNTEAARLGATSTTARNPSGLDAEGQVTTARDLAVIGRAALANPEIAGYLALTQVDFPGKRFGKGKRVIYPIYNHNRMLTDGFKGALGGKSGYTSKAGRTFVAAADRNGRRLLVSLLDIGGNTYTAGERLLAWGFANADSLKPVGQLAQPSAPAPTFDRAIIPLPSESPGPGVRDSRDSAAAASPDAPTGAIRPRSWRLPSLPTPSWPSPLSLLTILAGIIVALRARVYWVGHRDRTASTRLDLRAPDPGRRSGRRSHSGRRLDPGQPSGSRAEPGRPTRSRVDADDEVEVGMRR
ncbi:MAG: D-alanyl-D-alanine carboxypeptidase family protein [Candidatus Nanopelagicales bacterium]